jgi:hypothetical protein
VRAARILWAAIVDVAVLLSVATAGCGANSAVHPAPRTEGVYQSVDSLTLARVDPETGKQIVLWTYVRFYADGTVLTTLSSATPSELEAWFKRGNPLASEGRVVQDGEKLSFSGAPSGVMVEYQGTIVGATLRLSSRERINGWEAEEVFRFIDWPTAETGNK